MKARKKKTRSRRCPCGARASYLEHCRPYHRGKRRAESLEELVRSRFSAYARDQFDYIRQTTDPEGARWEEDEEVWRQSVKSFSEGFTFLYVEILDQGVDGDEGWLTFRANLRAGHDDATFEERSRFRKHQGRWVYVDGTTS